jgi:hypothetical protein
MSADLTGHVYGRLTVLGSAGRRGDFLLLSCLCSCGAKVIKRQHSVLSGRTQSCGCLQREKSTRHGMRRTSEYGIWENIVARCTNPKNTAFEHYGARGITLCERWRDFANFYADMGPRPSPKHTVEREDNDRGYEPGNCVWATRSVQQNNRRVNRRITFEGRTQTVTQWERERGFKPGTINHRLKIGWPVEKAVSAPVGRWANV